MNCEVYNICKSKMDDINSTKTGNREIKVYYEVLKYNVILHAITYGQLGI